MFEDIDIPESLVERDRKRGVSISGEVESLRVDASMK
jgi:hypothetical protein